MGGSTLSLGSGSEIYKTLTSKAHYNNLTKKNMNLDSTQSKIKNLIEQLTIFLSKSNIFTMCKVFI